MKLFAMITGFLGDFFARNTSGACFWTYLDEEEMPESLNK